MSVFPVKYRTMNDKSRADNLLMKFKNNKLIAILIVIGIVYFAVSKLLSVTDKNIEIIYKYTDSPVKEMGNGNENNSVNIILESNESNSTQADVKNQDENEINYKPNEKVNPRDTNDFPNEAKDFFSTITILSEIKEMEIFIDGNFYGKTDKDIELPYGRYTIELVKGKIKSKGIIEIPKKHSIYI